MVFCSDVCYCLEFRCCLWCYAFRLVLCSHTRSLSLPLSLLLSLSVLRSPPPATRCPPSVVMTWFTTGSTVWPSVCIGMCARSRRGCLRPRTPQTQRTDSAPTLPFVCLFLFVRRSHCLFDCLFGFCFCISLLG